MGAMEMRVDTKFTSAEQFVRSFAPFCSDTACFIPSAEASPTDIENAFSIRLADGTAVIRGFCIVRESWTTAANPYGRPGVELGIRKLTPESQEMFEQLSQVTVQMPPLVFEEDAIPEEIDDAKTEASRPPVMTLLGFAPLEEEKPRRVAMVALAGGIRTTPAPRRGMWDRMIGRVHAMFRTLRWAYRRRRGVRASVRRLPTRI